MVVPSPPSEGRRSRMTQDDVLFGYRLQLFDLAARTTVSHACRTFGVHRSTYYRWKAQVDRQGLEMLRPRERRRPQMPNQIPHIVEQRIVAFSPGSRSAADRGDACAAGVGRVVRLVDGVWKVLRRHGISTRAWRLGVDRRLPRALRAAARGRTRAACR